MRTCYWSGWRRPSLVNSNWSYVAFFAAKVRAIYLVLVDNKTIMAYFLEYQLIGPLLNMKIKPKIDFWFFLLSA